MCQILKFPIVQLVHINPQIVSTRGHKCWGANCHIWYAIIMGFKFFKSRISLFNLGFKISRMGWWKYNRNVIYCLRILEGILMWNLLKDVPVFCNIHIWKFLEVSARLWLRDGLSLTSTLCVHLWLLSWFGWLLHGVIGTRTSKTITHAWNNHKGWFP